MKLSPKSSPPGQSTPYHASLDFTELAGRIKVWGHELGFQQVGITDTDLSEDEPYLMAWLGKHRHGEMDYMQRHGNKRSRPASLVPGTVRIISVRMDYWPGQAAEAQDILDNPAQAYLSRYALGRDYHKIVRKRLQLLAKRIEQVAGAFGYRAMR